MYSQIDIRYSVSTTVNDVKALVNAFPGNITLCLENKTLYQYCEYASASDLPVADNVSILETTDSTLLSRWVAVDAYTAKSLIGSFVVNDWDLTVSGETYTYTIQLLNKVGAVHVVLLDNSGKVVYPEDIDTSYSNGITSVVLTVGANPDCRFAGKYLVFFDGVL